MLQYKFSTCLNAKKMNLVLMFERVNKSSSLLLRLKSGHFHEFPSSKPCEKVVQKKQLHLKYFVTAYL